MTTEILANNNAAVNAVNNVLVIKTKDEFEKIANPVFVRRAAKSYNVLQLFFNVGTALSDDKEIFMPYNIVRAGILTQPYGRMAKRLNISSKRVVTQIGDISVVREEKKNNKVEETFFTTSRRVDSVRRFTFDEIHVSVNPDGGTISFLEESWGILIKGEGDKMIIGLARKDDKTGKTVVYRIDKKTQKKKVIWDKREITVTPWDDVTDEFFREGGELTSNVRVYRFIRGLQWASAGQTKGYDFTIPESRNKAKTFSELNVVTNGTIGEIFSEDSMEKKMSVKKLASLANRLSLAVPPSGLHDPNKYHLQSVAVCMWKWSDAEGNEYKDGQHLGSTRSIAQALNAEFPGKIVVEEDVLLSTFAQDRPFAAVKASVRFVKEADLADRVFNLFAPEAIVADQRKADLEERDAMTDPIVVLYKNKITKEQQREFNNAVLFGEGEYAGKIVFILDNEDVDYHSQIDMVTDLNALKAPWDLRTDSNWHVLKFAHAKACADDEGGKLSGQLMQTLAWVDPAAAIRWAQQNLVEQVSDQRNILIDNTAENNTADKALSAMLFKDAAVDIATVAAQIAPEYVRKHDQGVYRAAANNVVKSQLRTVNNVSLKLAGAYLMVTPEIATDYGLNLLNIGFTKDGVQKVEVFCPHANLKGVSEFVAIKYPKMHVQEFLLCKAVSEGEYIRRLVKALQEGKISSERYEALVMETRNMSKGIVMIPSRPELMKLAAGLDFDSDAMQCFYDPFVVETCKQLKMLAVEIKAPNGDPTKLPFDENLGMNMLMAFASNDNLGVGIVTVYNEALIELYHIIDGDDEEMSKWGIKLFGQIFAPWKKGSVCKGKDPQRKCWRQGKLNFADFDGKLAERAAMPFELKLNLGVNKTASGLDSIKVDATYAESVTYACEQMKLTKENCLAGIRAMIPAMRMYQELTIDAAKKMYEVILYFSPLSVIKLQGRRDIKFEIVWDGQAGHPSFRVKGIPTAGHKGMIAWDVDTFGNRTAPALDKYGKFQDPPRMENLLCDTTQQIRVSAMGALKDTARAICGVKQTVLPEIQDLLLKTVNTPEYKEIVKALYNQKRMYDDLTSIKIQEIVNLEAEITDNPFMNADAADKLRKFINAKYNEMYAGIANNIRLLFAEAGIKDNDVKVAITLASGLKRDKDYNVAPIKSIAFADMATSFASRVLPQEYLHFIVEHFAEVTETRDRLFRVNGVSEGDVLTFTNGIGVGEAGQTAMTKSPIQGDFEVKVVEETVLRKTKQYDPTTKTLIDATQETKRKIYYATKKIIDLVPVPEADPGIRVIVSLENDAVTNKLLVDPARENQRAFLFDKSEVILDFDKKRDGSQSKVGRLKVESLQTKADGTKAVVVKGNGFKFKAYSQLERNILGGLKTHVASTVAGMVGRSESDANPMCFIMLADSSVLSEEEQANMITLPTEEEEPVSADAGVASALEAVPTPTDEDYSVGYNNIVDKLNIAEGDDSF